MGTATAQVFETTELLEMVLYRLAPPDLLRVSAVCKRWKSVVENSVRLRRRLYFAPDPDSRDVYGLNPFFVQRFTVRRDAHDGMMLCISSRPTWHFRFSDSPSSASWRRMLVAQPPEPFRIDQGPGSPSCGFGDTSTCGEAWTAYYNTPPRPLGPTPSTRSLR